MVRFDISSCQNPLLLFLMLEVHNHNNCWVGYERVGEIVLSRTHCQDVDPFCMLEASIDLHILLIITSFHIRGLYDMVASRVNDRLLWRVDEDVVFEVASVAKDVLRGNELLQLLDLIFTLWLRGIFFGFFLL